MKKSDKITAITTIVTVGAAAVLYWLLPDNVHGSISVIGGLLIGAGVKKGLEEEAISKKLIDGESKN